MSADFLGNPVSAADPAVLAGIDDFVGGFLAYESRAARILGAATTAPDDALANAYAGILWMLLESPEGPTRAAHSLALAKAAAPRANDRERKIVDLLDAWMRDDVPHAIRICDEIAAAFPRDLVVVKLNQYFNFNQGRFPEMLRAVEAVLDANRDLAWTYGMLAFAYEQCHLLEEAEAVAREALRIEPAEPWAHHALAHVMITQGRIDEGAAFLESVKHTWVGLNSFMYTHLWWHLALFRLSQGRADEVLAIYDRHVWGVDKDYSQDQVGAVSLLARIELAGGDVGGRWDDLADHLAARGPDTTQPFLAVQYLYGLARAGRPEADALLEAVRERAHAAPAYVRRAWRETALPLAEGLVAHARGDWTAAEDRLTPALAQLQTIGGSHAQRDLFDQFRLDAVLRSGDLSLGQQLLELRRASDRDGAPVNLALARVYRALNLPREAAKAEARVQRTLSRRDLAAPA